MEKEKEIISFENRKIRRIFYNDEWHFSVIDIIQVLTDSPSPRQYWGVLKGREPQLLTICLQLKLISSDGKYYATDCVNTNNAFRLVQSIPSKKAEPFKRWLAKVGYERIQEIQNPELAIERAVNYYSNKGYSTDWIAKRISSTFSRKDLINEWKERGITENRQFAKLTDDIVRSTFDKTTNEYKEFKGLRYDENLRDNMDNLELIFTMLGEIAAKEISIGKDARGFEQNWIAAKEAASIAKNAKKELENKRGSPIINKKRHLLSKNTNSKIENKKVFKQ